MWNVFVDNIGKVFTGSNGFKARQEYAACRKAWPDNVIRLDLNGETVLKFNPDDGFWFVEVTDLYGGEANYCWVKRYKVKARTARGAINKVPGAWRNDGVRYVSGGCCAFVQPYETEFHSEYDMEVI